MLKRVFSDLFISTLRQQQQTAALDAGFSLHARCSAGWEEFISFVITLFKFIFCLPDSEFPCLVSALIVRFLTKRFIGDYEANTGEFYLHPSANKIRISFSSVSGKNRCIYWLTAKARYWSIHPSVHPSCLFRSPQERSTPERSRWMGRKCHFRSRILPASLSR